VRIGRIWRALASDPVMLQRDVGETLPLIVSSQGNSGIDIRGIRIQLCAKQSRIQISLTRVYGIQCLLLIDARNRCRPL
jgi:hypothetical protein